MYKFTATSFAFPFSKLLLTYNIDFDYEMQSSYGYSGYIGLRFTNKENTTDIYFCTIDFSQNQYVKYLE
jgi:hypothetical protein